MRPVLILATLTMISGSGFARVQGQVTTKGPSTNHRHALSHLGDVKHKDTSGRSVTESVAGDWILDTLRGS